ncbi:MAG: hypothetical protein K6A35_08770 [bacterium]|nr:hypothetical protein [bacterium]
MPYFSKENPDFVKRVEDAVEKIEAKSDTEIVVVIAKQSSDYEYINYMLAMIWLMFFLCIFPFTPLYEFPLIVNIATIFFAIAVSLLLLFFGGRSDRIKRIFMHKKNIQQTVMNAALQIFMLENVSATRGRTGVLIYFSMLERRVVIMPDLGIDSKVPNSLINVFTSKINSAPTLEQSEKAFFEVMEQMEADLAKVCPIPEGAHKDNQIPNTPRFI